MNKDTKFFLAVAASAFIVILGLFLFSNQPTQPTQSSARNALGPDSAPVKIIEYADFQCPACAYGAPFLMEAVKANSDKVQLTYHHFPLSYHTNAYPAAYAAEAAGKQGKFWEMAEMLYDKQKEWANNNNPTTIFTSYAKALDLDSQRFIQDMDSKEVHQIVQQEEQESERLNIDSTPTYFINGKKVVGAQTVQQWQELISQAAK